MERTGDRLKDESGAVERADDLYNTALNQKLYPSHLFVRIYYTCY